MNWNQRKAVNMTEREQFEAWAKARYAKNPHFWLRQIDDGGYSCGMADSAWDAWQAARAQPAQAVPPGFVLVPLEPDKMWAYRVIRHHQPNLDVGCKAWLECLKEMLHWHAAIAAQGEKP